LQGKTQFRERRLAHGWRVGGAPGVPSELRAELIDEFIRPAVRAIPSALARRIPRCQIQLSSSLDPQNSTASRWTETESGLEIAIAVEETGPHDVAMELLVCLGQALWESATPAERRAWLGLLRSEMDENFPGEIDEGSLLQKRKLLSGRAAARSNRRLADYARASFAGTAAEYVHALWHDVTVRTGPDYLPPAPLRRRLEMMKRWFPPDPKCQLFAAGSYRRG
jgi:hypothetical protein